MTDWVQIDECAMSLANTESLLTQDVADSGADEGNRASAASTDLPRSRPTSPRPINIFQIYKNSIVATNSNLNGVTHNRGSHNGGG